MADDVATDVAAWRVATATLLSHAPAELDGPEAARVHRELRTVCDQVLAFAARLLPRVEADGRWAVGGARSFPEWVAGERGSSVGAARAEVVLGRALGGDLPVAAEAVESGRMTLEHAQVLARLAPTSEARRAALASDLEDRNEASLVARAEGIGVDEYRRVVKRWAATVDRAVHEREHLGHARRSAW